MVQDWGSYVRNQGAEIKRLQSLCTGQQHDLKRNKFDYSKLEQDRNRLSGLEQSLNKQLRLEQNRNKQLLTKYEELHATTSTEIQLLQQKNQDCQTHIGRMSQIISQLSKRGLPEAHDDHYFMGKLDDLVESISQWARSFSRGQPLLTMEDLRTTRVTERVRVNVTSAFQNVKSLLDAKNVGGKVRTRIVEAIMLRTLMGDRLWNRHLGFLETDYQSHRKLIQGMSCTGKSHRSNYLFSYSFLVIR